MNFFSWNTQRKPATAYDHTTTLTRSFDASVTRDAFALQEFTHDHDYDETYPRWSCASGQPAFRLMSTHGLRGAPRLATTSSDSTPLPRFRSAVLIAKGMPGVNHSIDEVDDL